jgi:hypothetical protein
MFKSQSVFRVFGRMGDEELHTNLSYYGVNCTDALKEMFAIGRNTHQLWRWSARCPFEYPKGSECTLHILQFNWHKTHLQTRWFIFMKSAQMLTTGSPTGSPCMQSPTAP